MKSKFKGLLMALGGVTLLLAPTLCLAQTAATIVGDVTDQAALPSLASRSR
ncbi:MAG: hypothetical protein R2748_16615 [Bryobacterales bacterium]